MKPVGPIALANVDATQLAKVEAPQEDPDQLQGVTAKALNAADVARVLTGSSGSSGLTGHGGNPATGDVPRAPSIKLHSGDTAQVRIRDSKVTLHPSWLNTPLAAAMDGEVLDLNRLDGNIMGQLGPNERQILMHLLGKLELAVERRDTDGALLTGPAKNPLSKHFGRLGIEMLGKVTGTMSTENAAEVIARKVWAGGNAEAFARTFGAAPELVMPAIQARAAKVLSSDMLTTVFEEMLASRTAFGKPGMDPNELDGLGDLFGRFFRRFAGRKPEHLESAFRHLMAAFDRSDLQATPQTAGIITGSVLAGMQKALGKAWHDEKIKAGVLGVTTANIWAATGFMGGAGAFVAVAVVGLDTLYQTTHLPKDNRELANRCQGAIQAHVLDHPPEGWSRDDVSDWMSWMNTTILSNGARSD